MSHKILILDTGKEWGGGTVSLIELLKRIDKNRYAFTALFYHNYNKGTESNIKKELENLGINFILLPPRPKSIKYKIVKEALRIFFFFSKALRQYAIFWVDYFFRVKPKAKIIAQIIKELNIDLIYMNNQPATNLEGILAAKITGIPAVLHCRTMPKLNRFLINQINGGLEKIICVSKNLKDFLLEKGVIPEKCVVVYDGIDINLIPSKSSEEIKQGLKLSEKEIIIGTVGTLRKIKRMDDLIEAIFLVKPKTDKPIKLVVVGDGPERNYLIELVQKRGLEKEVIFTGFQSDAISYINFFDIFVLASEREGLPRVILEAMLMGKPVVASKIPGVVEQVIEGETGFLVPPKNPQAFAEKILTLINDPELRRTLGERGRKRILERFAMERYVKEVEKVFEEVLRNDL
ncbi:glycosyltransferase family 4 protein [Thermodesulfobacterium sp. TA1]|uniref:glycosyltransferase n=1 Tax=Thermodesulfobacterium sp. TA1 TaxID=2234087 RepID=UPI0012326A49|nr:glycosyltransferase [Thermodesulfobacterium sp. TA1]QER42695.1 glycosyltransferase family 4 protein [Thermodesulfobacterium sp. TA1]